MPINYSVEYPKLQKKCAEKDKRIEELERRLNISNTTNEIQIELIEEMMAQLEKEQQRFDNADSAGLKATERFLKAEAKLEQVRGLPVYDGHFMDSDNRRIPTRVMRSEEVFKAILEKDDEV